MSLVFYSSELVSIYKVSIKNVQKLKEKSKVILKIRIKGVSKFFTFKIIIKKKTSNKQRIFLMCKLNIKEATKTT